MKICDLHFAACDPGRGDARSPRLAAPLAGRCALPSTNARSRPASGAVKQHGMMTRRVYSPAASGFTLAELIVVMGLIVLLITLAVPAIRAMTGTKSEEAARNTLSAFLGRVRTEAIGLQQTQGVLFFIDQATQRVAAIQVQAAPQLASDNNGLTSNSHTDRYGLIYLDAVPDRDVVYLPSGIRLQTIKDVSTTYLNKQRFQGFDPSLPGSGSDSSGQTPLPVGGVILFDGTGRTIAAPYGLRLFDATPGGKGQTDLGKLLHYSRDWPAANQVQPTVSYVVSQLGFVLFDKDQFSTAATAAGGNELEPKKNAAPQLEQWLDTNATPILINRNDGTLIRAE